MGSAVAQLRWRGILLLTMLSETLYAVSMNLADYLNEERGRARDLALALPAQQALVSQWANGVRPVPPDRCVDIERITCGVVSRRDLRPDDWHRIWPELVTKKHPAPSGLAVQTA